MFESRYSILIVEDEYYDVVLGYLYLKGLIETVPADLPNVNSFNSFYEEYRHRKRELVEVYTAGSVDKAIEVFNNKEGKINIAIIDINLSADINDFNKQDYFGGFRAYREMCKLQSQLDPKKQPLFIIYTQDPKALEAFDYLLIKADSDLKLLSRITRPIILAFGEKGKTKDILSSQRKDEFRSRLEGDFGDKVLLRLIEDHLAIQSREIIKRSEQRILIKQLLREVETPVEYDTLNEVAFRRLGALEFDGWLFKYLYPIDYARIGNCDANEDLNECLRRLRRKIFLGFRHQLKELVSVVDSLGHVDQFMKWEEMRTHLDRFIDGLSDIWDNNYRFRPMWEDLTKAIRQNDNGNHYRQWRNEFLNNINWNFSDVIGDLLGQDDACDWYCQKISRTGSEYYFIWQPDFKDALKVINANATHRGWGKGSSVAYTQKALCIGKGDSDDEFWIEFQTDDKPMTTEDIESAKRSCGYPYEFVEGKGVSQKLPDLIYIVCECYDGRIEIISTPTEGDIIHKIVIYNRLLVKTISCQKNTEGDDQFLGTKYRLIFPKGVDDTSIDPLCDGLKYQIEPQIEGLHEELPPAPERTPPVGFVDVMVADDNGYDPQTIKALRKIGYNIEDPARNLEEAFNQLNLFRPSVVLADLHFPSGEAGKELLNLALSTDSVRQVIAISRARVQHGELPMEVDDCCGGVDYRDPERIHRLIWRRATLGTVKK